MWAYIIFEQSDKNSRTIRTILSPFKRSHPLMTYATVTCQSAPTAVPTCRTTANAARPPLAGV